VYLETLETLDEDDDGFIRDMEGTIGLVERLVDAGRDWGIADGCESDGFDMDTGSSDYKDLRFSQRTMRYIILNWYSHVKAKYSPIDKLEQHCDPTCDNIIYFSADPPEKFRTCFDVYKKCNVRTVVWRTDSPPKIVESLVCEVCGRKPEWV